MDRETTTPGRQFVESLLDRIRSETCWQPRAAPEAVGERFDTACMEPPQHCDALFSRPETDAKIVLTVPTRRRGQGAKLVLDNVFDSGLRTSEDRFSRHLSDAHRSIAASHGTAYTETVTDPVVICRVFVPLDYDSTILDETLSALDRMARESQDLHAAIENALSTYLATEK